MELFTTRQAAKIAGELSCLDRVVITGTVLGTCYAQPLRERIRTNAQRLAAQEGLTIEHVREADLRKGALVRQIVERRCEHEGLVCILSAMEACPSYRPWHDKAGGRTFLKDATGKCLHYYFYFIDKDVGLCYLRVPTWVPFRLQFYFNGHNAVADALGRRVTTTALRLRRTLIIPTLCPQSQ